MEQVLADTVAKQRFSAALLAAFACSALLIAGIGVYGVLSYSVAERVPEVGLRRALGAQTTDVVALVMRQGLGWAALGVALGIAGALAGGRLLASELYETHPADPVALSGAAILLLAAGLLASFLPAWRAARVDPLEALRQE